MEVGNSIQKSFDLYLKNFGVLLSACLVAGIISAVTFGILAGPLIGGVLVLCLKLLYGEKGDFNEIFTHLDQFIPTLVATLMLWAAWLIVLVINMISIVGWIIDLVVLPMLGLLYFLTIGFIVDQKMQPLDALRRSVDCCVAEPLILWFYSLAIMILAGIGAFLIIPVILTMPFGAAGLTIAYQQLSTREVPPFKPDQQVLLIAGIFLGVIFVTGLVCMVFGFGSLFFRAPVWTRW